MSSDSWSHLEQTALASTHLSLLLSKHDPYDISNFKASYLLHFNILESVSLSISLPELGLTPVTMELHYLDDVRMVKLPVSLEMHVMHLLKYLEANKDLPLRMSGIQVHADIDALYAIHTRIRPHFGIAFCAKSGTIKAVFPSSTEVELHAANEASSDRAMHFQEPVCMYEDNLTY